jgi:hypothetical protein
MTTEITSDGKFILYLVLNILEIIFLKENTL